ncbi:hypothetical protein [Parvularcula sp. IMCC14364]|uniref:hypothetical protein n=1 Tax=Parvularcula sp. IMCC14364 TaxID=3067902 RepID=UPI0027420D56|nr:hypothetical protein [Parvularcula sp. IMCC14364]
MLLRRVMGHVKDQNWLAVGIDFLIVVSGVFIGLQVSEWNDNRNSREAYQLARERLVAESEANLDAVDAFLAGKETTLPLVRSSIDVLRRCAAAPEDLVRFEAGLNIIRGTPTLRLRHSAIESLTSNEAFLAQQSETERNRLDELRRRLTQAQDTLNWLETWPFDSPIEDHPAIGFGDLTQSENMPGIADRRLTLSVPLAEACQDQRLAKHFYLWERVALFQSIRAGQVKTWMEANISMMSTG